MRIIGYAPNASFLLSSDSAARVGGNCRAFDSLAPASSPFGLPVYVARRPAAPFCETPIRWRLTQTPYNVIATV